MTGRASYIGHCVDSVFPRQLMMLVINDWLALKTINGCDKTMRETNVINAKITLLR